MSGVVVKVTENKLIVTKEDKKVRITAPYVDNHYDATFASDAETLAGTVTTKAISPASLEAVKDVEGGLASKAYADAKITQTITEDVTTTAPSEGAVFDALALKAPLASPALTGNPTAPTQSIVDKTDRIATTMFVKNHFVESRNLFNKDTVTTGMLVNEVYGYLSASASYVASDYISVEAGETYYRSGVNVANKYYAWYDADKNFISTTTITSRILTAPANAAYIRLSNKSVTAYYDIQFEKGETPTAFISYGTKIDTDRIPDESISGDKIIDGTVTPKKTNTITSGKNLFDKYAVTTGKYVNDTTGQLKNSTTSCASDYIPVESGETYSSFSARYMAFYDSNKNYISGIGNSGARINSFVAPDGAAYVRLTYYTSEIDTMQVEKGERTSYEAYGYAFTRPLLKDMLFDVKISLPSKIYALVGQELNIYFDNIINDRDTRYDFDVTCSIGAQYDNYYRVTPITAGSYTITIDVIHNGAIVAAAQSTIFVTSAAVGASQTRKILVIGDSTTANGIAVTKLNVNFDADVMNVNCIGTKGTTPNQHEGISGWTINRFYTAVTSPFVYDGVFNFGAYMTANSYTGVDVVVINLGINDIFTLATDIAVSTAITTMLAQLQGMIDSIHTYDVNIKIGLCITIPPAYDQSSFGKNHGCTYRRNRYKRNNFMWCDALIDAFDVKTADNIYLIPVNVNLDTRYNMTLETLPVNARNTDVTVQSITANGSVHPDTSGYWQIADVYWYWLKSFEV